jgi:hypothetical protein
MLSLTLWIGQNVGVCDRAHKEAFVSTSGSRLLGR